MANTPLKLKLFRNIGIIAHIDAGKTTVTERILYYSGKEHNIGNVDDGSAHMDWMQEERDRGITITSAATTIYWNKYRINIIDTPGHVDFTCEVERALRALDGAIGIFDGVAGVEAQSETVWRQADNYNVPRIAFINKLDKTGADFEYSVNTLVKKLKINPVILCFPDGVERDFKGIVDVLGGVYLTFDESDQGKTVHSCDVPEKIREKLEEARERVCELACEYSEELLKKYINGEETTREEIEAALRTGVLKGELTPVYCGAALRNKGIQTLLEGVCKFLPSPLDRGKIFGKNLAGDKDLERKPEITESFSALVFKVQFDEHGDLIFARIYSGKVRQGQLVLLSNLRKKERIGKIFLLHADARVEKKIACAGEIVAFRGLKLASTGHTLCDVSHPIVLEGISFPETVVSQAIEPINASERDRLMDCLKLLSREDPTFNWKFDEDTGQLIVKGMGELHLEVIIHRLLEDWKIKAHVGKPRVWYRQTVKKTAVGEATFERELGNKHHFAALKVEVSHDSELITPEVTIDLDPTIIHKQFWPVVKEGLQDAAKSGGYLGFPWIQIHVRAFWGETRVGESSEVGFAAVSQEAFNNAVEKAGRIILEPVMHFDIFTPSEFYGAVSSDLTRRRAEIKETNLQIGGQRIEGIIPLSKTFGYMSTLRSLTQGRATMTLEPSGFALAPEEVAARFNF